MSDRCAIRIPPVGRGDGLPTMKEWITWEPCPGDVVFWLRDPNAHGGMLRLCEEHSKKLKRWAGEHDEG